MAPAAPVPVPGDDARRRARRTRRWILAAILVAGFGLRLWGCFGQGLPYTFYKDEENNVQRALKFGAQQTLNPGWFNKPAFGYYLWFAEFGAYFVTGRVLGWFEDPTDFAISYFNNPGPFYVIGRVNATVFGTLGLILAYLLGKRLRDRTTGLLTAVALAVTFGQVASCQEVKKDVVAAFFTAWSGLLLINILERGRWKDYLLSGLLAGLGAATKYYSVALIVSYLLAHVFREPAARARAPRMWFSPRLVAGAGSFFLGFFVGSPYNFLSRQFYDERIVPLLRSTVRRFVPSFGQSIDLPHPGLVTPENSIWDSFQYLFDQLWSTRGIGPLLSVLALLGILACGARVRRRPGSPGNGGVFEATTRSGGTARKDALLLVTVFVFLSVVAIANQEFPEPRHASILYPFAAVLAAIGFRHLWAGLSAWVRAREGLGRLVVPAFVLLVCVPARSLPVYEIVASNQQHLRKDPRLRVLAWIETNIRAGQGIINDKEWLPLKPTLARCNLVLRRLEKKRRDLQQSAVRLRREQRGEEASDRIGLLLKDVDRTDTYLTLWQWEKRSVPHALRPTYEVIPWNHDWFTSYLNDREPRSGEYNPTWEHSPWGYLFCEIFQEAGRREAKLSAEEAARQFRLALHRDLDPFLRNELKAEGLTDAEIAAQFPQRLAEVCRDFHLTDSDVSLVELWRRKSPVSVPWLTQWTDEKGREQHVPITWFVSAKVTYDNYMKPMRRRNFPDWAAFYDDLKAHYDSYEFDPGLGIAQEVFRVWDLRERKDTARVIQVQE